MQRSEMGEPACLRRSFSSPSNASREAKEGNPIRALTESISFGRFMSESLAWEKWSTFSHNRYLEEVEQFSKPGYVAQKKAFFEAHYKKRAAMKAAALLEQANAVVNNVPEVGTASVIQDDSPVDSELAEGTSDTVINEKWEKDVLRDQLAHPADANSICPNGQGDISEKGKIERYEVVMEQIVEGENPTQLKNSKQLENVDKREKIVVTPEEKMPNQEAAEKENAALPSNKRQINSSTKSPGHGRASKLPKPSAKQVSSTQPKAGISIAPNSKKSAGELIDKKMLTPKSAHMSINFASHSGETGKNSLRMLKDGSTTPRSPNWASGYGVSKLLPSLVRQSEDRRTKSLLNKSVSGGSIAGRILQAFSGDSKSLSSSGSKPRSPIISSPFSFRSEERAAKRKEKLEEKNNAKEAGKTHLQVNSKQKPEHDRRKLQQSTGLRARPREDSLQGSQSPNNQLKKIPLTRPRSPKLGRRPSPSVTQETSSRLPQRPSVNAESFKHVVPKTNQSTARSVISLQKKKAHENASPNILH